MPTIGQVTGDNRPEPPLSGDEASTLRGFLDFLRATLAVKTDGLSAEQLATTLAPSTITLGGLLKHLALVEGFWFVRVLGGGEEPAPFDQVPEDDNEWEWRTAADDEPDDLRGWWRSAVATSDAAIDAALATPDGMVAMSAAAHPRNDARFSLRWILTHMIEEYARHLGHADLIRESIDGSTGQ